MGRTRSRSGQAEQGDTKGGARGKQFLVERRQRKIHPLGQLQIRATTARRLAPHTSAHSAGSSIGALKCKFIGHTPKKFFCRTFYGGPASDTFPRQ